VRARAGTAAIVASAHTVRIPVFFISSLSSRMLRAETARGAPHVQLQA
jgi:hypothetical protein